MEPRRLRVRLGIALTYLPHLLLPQVHRFLDVHVVRVVLDALSRDLAPRCGALRSDADDWCVIGKHSLGILRVFGSQLAYR